MKQLFAAIALVALASCGGGGGPGVNTDLGQPDPGVTDPGIQPDVGPDVPADVPVADEGVVHWDQGGETVPDGVTETGELPDVPVPPDEGEADAPDCPGAFGCKCTDNSECFSGFCVETMTGSVCTILCQSGESCAAGWKCEQVGNSGTDVIYACVDPTKDLCRPCKADEDCAGTGGKKNLCVDSGPAGKFCGVECADSAECPEGFTCKDVETPRGQVKQCRPTGGASCPCTDKFMEKGYKTTCFIQNEIGKCVGERTCDSTCDAVPPSPEVCDGKDNDCNGTTDVGIVSKDCELKNDYGTCQGLILCVSGQELCQGTYAEPEVCNGKDDDCDGTKDEGYPDTDKDGLADCIDFDTDGDGIPNVSDNCPEDANPGQENNDGDKDGDACDQDDDNDGIPDDADNCQYVKNTFQEDADKDGKGDVCDCDIDGDGIGNPNPGCPEPLPADNCPYVPNPDQKDVNHNGIGDKCEGDKDGDGIPDGVDNCPDVPNGDQKDTDGDKKGDACDPDDDNDGIPDALDNCVLTPNADQKDFDWDGQGDACDPDDDNDGWADALDCKPQDATINPGAPEICDGLDNNCSGKADEGCGYVGFDIRSVSAGMSRKLPDGSRLDVSVGGGPGGVNAPEGSKYLLDLVLYPTLQ